MNNNNSNDFSYKYNAREAAEVKRIREKYAEPEEETFELLLRLDRNVGVKARSWALTVGIIGTLIMGGGMSLCLVGRSEHMAVGVCIGLLGIIIAAAAYPIYSKLLVRERKRIAPTVLALTDKLLK